MRKPDVAYVNGKVYTVDPNFSVATAFCLSDDRFVAVGTDEEIGRCALLKPGWSARPGGPCPV